MLRDSAARPAVRALRAEALRELGRLFVEAAAMHCEVAAANGASAQARFRPYVTGRRRALSTPGQASQHLHPQAPFADRRRALSAPEQP